jgi:hypothetical protein
MSKEVEQAMIGRFWLPNELALYFNRPLAKMLELSWLAERNISEIPRYTAFRSE